MQLRHPEISPQEGLEPSSAEKKNKYKIAFEEIEGLQPNNIIVLGRGCHSTVYAGKYLSKEVAVKKITIISDTIENQISKLLQDAIAEEGITTSHFVPYYGCALEQGVQFLVYARMLCTLEDWIEKLKNGSNLSLNYRLMGHIAEALAYLHKNLIIHCDIKPDNIFISKNDFQTSALLGDFSLSLLKGGTFRHLIPAGSLLYSPPELLRTEEACENSEATDVYSLGLVFYFVATSRAPYHDYSDPDLFTHAVGYVGVPLYKDFKAERDSPKLMAMTKWCALNASERPTAKELANEFATSRNAISKKLSFFTQKYKCATLDETSRQKTRELLPGCMM